MVMAQHLGKRQGSGFDSFGDGGNDYYDGVSWWWTPTGMAVRYSMIALLFGLLLLYLVGGYYHAQRRIRRGLPPLGYHRWMVSRRTYYPAHPYVAPYYQPNQAGHGYNMQSHPPPPPAYNPQDAPPPVYQPPEGGSKVAADQNFPHMPTQRAGQSSQPAGGVAAPPAVAGQRGA